MKIEELKKKIEDRTISDDLLVLIDSDPNHFISRQYISEIARIKNKEIVYLDSIKKSLFWVNNPKVLYVYITDEVLIPDTDLSSHVIICKSSKYPNAVKIPKLEEWMISDYLYSKLPGVSRSKLDKLLVSCKNNISMIQSNLDKVAIFSEDIQDLIFSSCLEENQFTSSSSVALFDLTNAILNRDINKTISVLKNSNISLIDPVAFLTTIMKTFRSLIVVWMNKNPTPDNTELKANLIWAILKLKHNYTAEQLVKIYSMLTDLDFQFKSGYLSTTDMIDYIITKIYSY